MKKLSEFTGQEHITSVLRASIIKKEHLKEISISGDARLAHDIGKAYRQSLECNNPERGDACGKCAPCCGVTMRWANFEFYDEFRQGATNFELKTTVGTYIDPDILSLLIYAYQADKADVIKQAKHLALTLTFDKVSTGLISILTNILYLKSNLEITELDKLEALRALSVRMSTFDLTAAIRLVWDAQSKGVLPDFLRIETTSLLLSEIFQPTPTPDKLVVQVGQTPIKGVEEDNLEQPLDLDKMLEIARS